MSEFLDLPVPFLLLLPLSIAAGVDFFLTLLVVGLSLGFGWPGMQEFGPDPLHWGILVGLSALYLAEAAAEIKPLLSLFWHLLQLFLRPIGGVLLAFALLTGLPLHLQIIGAAMGGVVCAFTHVLSWGRKLSIFLHPRERVSRTTEVLAEDTLVLVFLALTVDRPEIAFSLSGPILLLGLFLGGPCHHLVRFGVNLSKDRAWGFLSPPRWREGSELPSWTRKSIGGDALSPPRGIPVGVTGLPSLRGFREGWLLRVDGVDTFTYRKRRKPRVFSLKGISSGAEEDLGFALKVPLAVPEENESALFLQKSHTGLKSHK